VFHTRPNRPALYPTNTRPRRRRTKNATAFSDDDDANRPRSKYDATRDDRRKTDMATETRTDATETRVTPPENERNDTCADDAAPGRALETRNGTTNAPTRADADENKRSSSEGLEPAVIVAPGCRRFRS
jgi:hypothetical protein